MAERAVHRQALGSRLEMRAGTSGPDRVLTMLTVKEIDEVTLVAEPRASCLAGLYRVRSRVGNPADRRLHL